MKNIRETNSNKCHTVRDTVVEGGIHYSLESANCFKGKEYFPFAYAYLFHDPLCLTKFQPRPIASVNWAIPHTGTTL